MKKKPFKIITICLGIFLSLLLALFAIMQILPSRHDALRAAIEYMGEESEIVEVYGILQKRGLLDAGNIRQGKEKGEIEWYGEAYFHFRAASAHSQVRIKIWLTHDHNAWVVEKYEITPLN
ncbi:MAG: hypothetical protein FWF10_09080 [Clostridiales bacterium]|nr:hypothetical protein [Clostridiales bacterium]